MGNGTTFDSQPTFILPITFPSGDTMAFDWSTRLAVDVNTGELIGSGMEEVRIQSRHSGKCLDVAESGMSARANVLQWTCNQAHNQRWHLTEVEPGYFQIKALHSSQCLDVAATSLDDGANILQWPCNGSDNQLWSFENQGDGSFALASKHSGKCLDVAKWSTENGGNIQQWECTGRENQKFVEY